jgi:hypothetical protein
MVSHDTGGTGHLGGRGRYARQAPTKVLPTRAPRQARLQGVAPETTPNGLAPTLSTRKDWVYAYPSLERLPGGTGVIMEDAGLAESDFAG